MPPPDQTAADPSSLRATGRPGEYVDPGTGTVYLAPSTVYPASDDPFEQLRFEQELQMADMARTVERQVADKARAAGVTLAAPTARAAPGVETDLATRHGQHPAVAAMADALAGWSGSSGSADYGTSETRDAVFHGAVVRQRGR